MTTRIMTTRTTKILARFSKTERSVFENRTPGDIVEGERLYQMHCSVCHGVGGAGSSIGPDILEDVAEESVEDLVEVMLEGEDDMPAIGVTSQEALAIATWLKHVFADFAEEDEDE